MMAVPPFLPAAWNEEKEWMNMSENEWDKHTVLTLYYKHQLHPHAAGARGKGHTGTHIHHAYTHQRDMRGTGFFLRAGLWRAFLVGRCGGVAERRLRRRLERRGLAT